MKSSALFSTTIALIMMGACGGRSPTAGEGEPAEGEGQGAREGEGVARAANAPRERLPRERDLARGECATRAGNRVPSTTEDRARRRHSAVAASREGRTSHACVHSAGGGDAQERASSASRLVALRPARHRQNAACEAPLVAHGGPHLDHRYGS